MTVFRSDNETVPFSAMQAKEIKNGAIVVFQDAPVIIESIFSWPGIGRMAFEAILARDYPIILTVNFVSAVLVLAGTFISDILYMVVDPRIRL